VQAEAMKSIDQKTTDGHSDDDNHSDASHDGFRGDAESGECGNANNEHEQSTE
jgi:hypothetical protein